MHPPVQAPAGSPGQRIRMDPGSLRVQPRFFLYSLGLNHRPVQAFGWFPFKTSPESAAEGASRTLSISLVPADVGGGAQGGGAVHLSRQGLQVLGIHQFQILDRIDPRQEIPGDLDESGCSVFAGVEGSLAASSPWLMQRARRRASSSR